MITLQEVYNKCCEAVAVAEAEKEKRGNASVPNYIAKFKDFTDFSAISDDERKIWNERNFPQLHKVISKLGEDYRKKIWARFEYPVPGSEKRCDLILTGMGKEDKPVLLVVEFKSWEEFNISKKYTVYAVDKQINEYIELLQNRHEYCHDDNITIKGVGVFTKIKSGEIPENKESDSYPHHLIHCEDEDGQDSFINFLKDNFEATKRNPEDTIRKFDSGKFTYKKEDIVNMLTQLPELLPKISKILGSTNSITEFSPKYKEIIEGILSNIVSKKKSFTIVKGEAGSGKTAMAIYILLLHLYRNLDIENKQASCRLVIKSKVLREVLTKNMNDCFGNKLGENLIIFDQTFYDKDHGQYDLVIIDEAHSLSSIKLCESDNYSFPQSEQEMKQELKIIFNKTRHLVCFIDKNQSIYPKNLKKVLDAEFLKDTWDELNTDEDKKAEIFLLNEQYRLDEEYFKYINEFFEPYLKGLKENDNSNNIKKNNNCTDDNGNKKSMVLDPPKFNKFKFCITDDKDELDLFLNFNRDSTSKKLIKFLVNPTPIDNKKKYAPKYKGQKLELIANCGADIAGYMDVETGAKYNERNHYLNAFSSLGFDIDYGVLILDNRDNKISISNDGQFSFSPASDDFKDRLRYFWVILTRIKKGLMIFIDNSENPNASQPKS